MLAPSPSLPEQSKQVDDPLYVASTLCRGVKSCTTYSVREKMFEIDKNETELVLCCYRPLTGSVDPQQQQQQVIQQKGHIFDALPGSGREARSNKGFIFPTLFFFPGLEPAQPETVIQQKGYIFDAPLARLGSGSDIN